MAYQKTLSGWSAVPDTYDPLCAGSIDGTDTIPHDKAIERAMEAEYKTNKHVTSDPKRTLFVGRLNPKTQEEDVKKLNGHRLDDYSILVDFECERTLKGWIPRRLGGGIGGRKQSGQLRFGGIDRPFKRPIILRQPDDTNDKGEADSKHVRKNDDYDDDRLYRSHEHQHRASSHTRRDHDRKRHHHQSGSDDGYGDDDRTYRYDKLRRHYNDESETERRSRKERRREERYDEGDDDRDYHDGRRKHDDHGHSKEHSRHKKHRSHKDKHRDRDYDDKRR